MWGVFTRKELQPIRIKVEWQKRNVASSNRKSHPTNLSKL